MNKTFLILIVLILSVCDCFAIVENKKITINEAVNITLENNPRVKIEKLNTETFKNNIKSANRLKNPTIGTFQNMGPSGKDNPQQIGADYIIEILKRANRKNYAISEAKASLNNQKFLEQVLILEVKKAYINLLLKKTNSKILLEQKELAKELFDTIDKEYKKNKLPKTEIIQAKIAYNRSIMYYNIAKSEVISAQNKLNFVMNTSEFNYDTKEDILSENYNTLNAINPKENKINYEKIKEYALNNRYDLRKALQEIESAKNNLKVVKSKLIPDLELSGGYSYITKGMNTENKYNSGAFAGVNLVNIPLVYHYQPEIKNAQIEIEKAQLHYEDVTADVIRDLTDAWEKYTITKDNLNFYNKELLKNSDELLKESSNNLNTKKISVTEFLVSKKIHLELILGYYETLGDYYISCAELLKEAGAENFEELY